MSDVQIDPQQLEQARAKWAGIAQAHGWYTEPFYVQVWVNREGKIYDSVSFIGIEKDVVVVADCPHEDFDVHFGSCEACGEATPAVVDDLLRAQQEQIREEFTSTLEVEIDPLRLDDILDAERKIRALLIGIID